MIFEDSYFIFLLALKITCYQHVKGHHFSSLGVIYDLNPPPPYTLQVVRLFSETVIAEKADRVASSHPFFFFSPLHLLCTPTPAHFNGRNPLTFAATSRNTAQVPERANLRDAFFSGINIFHTLAKRILPCLYE